MEAFTAEEKKLLEPFVTNMDRQVFVLRNMPEVIKGALFSRYSRSTKPLRRLLLDEFIADRDAGLAVPQAAAKALDVQRAQAFYDRILDGYGDDSVGELGGAHIACEGVSNLAAKALEDARIGGSPLEKSTRYVWFNEKHDDRYLFYREPRIMASRFAREYERVCNLLFGTYADLSEKMMAFVREQWPIADFGFFDLAAKREIPFPEISDEKKKKRAAAAYNAAVRARACDALRGLLPASTLTNVGMFGNGRFFQSLLTRLYSSELAELRELGAAMQEELDKVIPSFVRRAKRDEYYVQNAEKLRARGKALDVDRQETEMVELVSYDANAENELIAKMLYPHVDVPLGQLKDVVGRMSSEEKMAIVDDYVGERKTRRDRPGRALEHAYYTFDMLGDFGSYRDLQRHRILTQERQLLATRNGFDLPEEIVAAGFRGEFEDCMRQAAALHGQLREEMPMEAQYVVPFAYNLRWYMKMNLREAMHMIELRSTPQGHPNYRKMAQEMFRRIEEVQPALAKYLRFVDMQDYPLGRLGAESRKEEKRATRSE